MFIIFDGKLVIVIFFSVLFDLWESYQIYNEVGFDVYC